MVTALLLGGCYNLGGDCCFTYECSCSGTGGAGTTTTNSATMIADAPEAREAPSEASALGPTADRQGKHEK
ncbi:MAG: hypothetical protein U0441_07815 [Polyangiaceae bacterium]